MSGSGRSAPRSSGATEMVVVSTIQETVVPGPIPRFEIPGWRERFGVVAGITGRGPAGARFDLGLWTSSPVGEVMGRWRQFRGAERGFRATVLGHQTHGVQVARTDAGEGWIQLEGVDGHVTTARGILLTVTVADCIPVYLVDVNGRGVALLHAGWRGTAGGILERGLKLLCGSTGSQPSSITMHCGVGICGECYEVGREVMDGCGLTPAGDGPWHVDIRAVLADQADGLGLREISTSAWCTRCQHDRFFSHRASGGTDGRQVAFLGMSA